jgi:predicted permease
VFSDLLYRLKALFRRSRVECEMDAELRFHFDAQVEKSRKEGMTREEAERRARVMFGGVERAKEEIREARGVNAIETTLQDLKYALRTLRKSPGFAGVVVLTLALGIGVNTAIFSIIDSVLLRPLPVKDPDHLVVMGFRQGQGDLATLFSYADFQDIRAQSTEQLSDLAGYQLGVDGLTEGGRTERILTNYVTGNYFSSLGLNPSRGRLILPGEGAVAGADSVIVLSYSYWKARFGGDANVVGLRVLINGHPMTVVGVAPKDFHGAYQFMDVQAYIPFAMIMMCEQGWPKNYLVDRIQQNLLLLGHLKARVNLASATASLNVIAQRLSTQYPETDKDLQLSIYPERYARPDPRVSPTVMRAAALFLALVALVLLLACANVANILLVRATTREREIGIRISLGAGRARLVRQLLTESMLLAFTGGLAGLALGWWCSRAIGRIDIQKGFPVSIDFGFDWRVFAYAFAAMLLTGVLVGIVPALRASRENLNSVLRSAGRTVAEGRQGLRTGLVVAQVAGSLTLLVIAGLFTKSLARVQRTNLGFDPHNVMNFTMDPSEIAYTERQGVEFYKALLERVRVLPGVELATLNSGMPLGSGNNNDYLKIQDYQSPPNPALPLVYYSVVSPEFFETLRIPIVRGRAFTEADIVGAPYTAIVSEAFAAQYWPSQDPIGKKFAKVSGITNPLYEVVGVARDARFLSLTGPIEPHFYLPLAQNYALASTQLLQVRSTTAPEAMTHTVQEIVQSLAPGMPVFNVQTMLESMDTLNGFMIFQVGAILAAALGGLGLVLAIVGVYGVISYSVSRRTHEIGIRMALGAERGGILKMVLRQGIAIVAIGVVIGAVAAILVARMIAGLLAGTSPTDPAVYAGVTLGLVIVALLACYVPARKAMRLDPITSLRQE